MPGHGAGFAPYDFTVFEQHDRGHGADIVARGSGRIFIDIDFQDAGLITELAGQFLEHRREGLAGAAPFGVEIDQYRLTTVDNLVEAHKTSFSDSLSPLCGAWLQREQTSGANDFKKPEKTDFFIPEEVPRLVCSTANRAGYGYKSLSFCAGLQRQLSSATLIIISAALDQEHGKDGPAAGCLHNNNQ